jgi:hypothetical protein
MIDNIIHTIAEVIELLDDCNLPAWANKYATWRQEIIDNRNDPERLEMIYRKLYVASAPRGFLGDFPIASSTKGKFKYEAIEKRRRDLVEKIISQLQEVGITI